MTETQRQPVPRVDDDELTTALAFLDFARESAIKKADGLSEQDVRRPMVPTGTSVLRLIRHLTDGERYWFVVHQLGRGEEPDWEAVEVDDGRSTAEGVAAYRAAIAASDRAIRQVGDPAALSARPVDDVPLPLRWTIAHMTSETARHVGHADIVRELLDGVTGR